MNRDSTATLRFLEQEDAFLNDVRSCVNILARHTVGDRSSDDVFDAMKQLQTAISERHRERLAFRERSAAIRARQQGSTPWPTFTSEGPVDQAAILRAQVRRKTLETQRSLRAIMLQVAESQVVVTTVLEMVLGAARDGERYDEDGRPVNAMMRVPGQRVA